MNPRGMIRPSLSKLLLTGALFALLLTACQAVNISTELPSAQPPTTVPAVSATLPVSATEPPAGAGGEISLDLAGVAQDQTVETVPAAPASAEQPYWASGPEYRLVTLQGYTLSEHLMKAQIFIYPAAELAASNETAGQMAADLQGLLEARGTVDAMPFLPLFNAAQVMHAQAQFLDFKNGSGVRFLTQYDQAPLPINSYELIYTFQGLTGDGKYYIAAVLPVSHPELPATQQVSAEQAETLSEFPTYLAETVAWLDEEPAGSFTPDLAKLDALVQSIEVK